MSETVVAVLLTQGSSPTLEETVSAVRAQSRTADLMVAVNIGDVRSGWAVCSVAGDIPIANISDERQISQAIGKLVRQEAQAASGQVWIWFIVDGTAVGQDALADMMAAVEKSPSVRAAGAKQSSEQKTLYDVGLTTSHWANPVTLIDDGESDQGQYDDRTDVLGVNLAGMLVAQHTWENLDGLDVNLPPGYQSLDFCWRVHLGGERVVVVPSAVVYHHDGNSGITAAGASSGTETSAPPLSEKYSLKTHPARMSAREVRAQRYSEAYLRLKNASSFAVIFLYCGLIVGSFFRLLENLVLKDLKTGWSQFLGATAVVLKPRKIFRARAKVNKIRRVSRSVIRNLQASNQEVWNYRRDYSPTVTTGERNSEEEQPTGEALAETAHDNFPQAKANFGLPLAIVLATAFSLGSIINFFGSYAIGGGATLPASKDLSELWHNATAHWVGTGAGVAAYPHPFSAVLWILGLLGLGNANIIIILLFMLSGPIAATGMWFLSGALTRRYFIRFLAAVIWAVAPVHSAAVAQGRLNSLIVFAAIPWVALALARAAGASRKDPYGYGTSSQTRRAINGSDGRVSWTAAAAAGLGLALLTACVPAFFLPMVVAILVAAIFLGKRGASVWWSVVPSIAVYLPYIWSFRQQPRAIVADPGVPVSTVPIPLWQQILGFADYFSPSSGIVGLEFLSEKLPEVPWALVGAFCITLPIVFLAVGAAMVRTGRMAAVRVLWAAIVFFLAASAICPLIVVAVDRDSIVTPWEGNFVIVIYLLLLCAAIVGADSIGYRKNIKEYEPRSHRRVLFIPLTLMLTAFVSGGAVFFLQQFVAPAEVSSDSPDGPAVDRQTVDSNNRPAVVSDAVPKLRTDQLGSRRWAQRVSDNAVPVTAADFGSTDLRTKTLVINASDDQPLAAALMRGSGDTLDSTHPIVSANIIRKGDDGTISVEYDVVDSMVRNTAAALVSGDEVNVTASHLKDLGVGFIVLRGQPRVTQPIVRALDAAPILNPIGLASHGWLWQVKGLEAELPAANGQQQHDSSNSIAYVRFADEEGNTVGTVPATYRGVRARVQIPHDAVKIVMAERFSPLWKASFNGQQLRPEENSAFQEFAVDHNGSGQLTVEAVTNSYDWLVKSIIIVIFAITFLLAVPVRTKEREAKTDRYPRKAAEVKKNDDG